MIARSPMAWCKGDADLSPLVHIWLGTAMGTASWGIVGGSCLLQPSIARATGVMYTSADL